eukprot:8483609-Pyramimonas_sp.AAC.1
MKRGKDHALEPESDAVLVVDSIAVRIVGHELPIRASLEQLFDFLQWLGCNTIVVKRAVKFQTLESNSIIATDINYLPNIHHCQRRALGWLSESQ